MLTSRGAATMASVQEERTPDMGGHSDVGECAGFDATPAVLVVLLCPSLQQRGRPLPWSWRRAR